jgi:hypothetical protein
MFHLEKISDTDGLRCIEKVEFINTVSKYIADTVITRFPSAEKKLHVVYSGVDTDLYKPVWAIARVLGGLAFIEFFTKEDDTIGDDDGFIPRSEATYRNLFREAGLVHLGLHCYTSRRFAADLMTFEKGKGSA